MREACHITSGITRLFDKARNERYHLTWPKQPGVQLFCWPVVVAYSNWLVVWNIFYFSIDWESHHPNWLICLRGVGIPPTSLHFSTELCSEFRGHPLMYFDCSWIMRAITMKLGAWGGHATHCTPNADTRTISLCRTRDCTPLCHSESLSPWQWIYWWVGQELDDLRGGGHPLLFGWWWSSPVFSWVGCRPQYVAVPEMRSMSYLGYHPEKIRRMTHFYRRVTFFALVLFTKTRAYLV